MRPVSTSRERGSSPVRQLAPGGCFKRSRSEMMPTRRSPSTTGRWRIRNRSIMRAALPAVTVDDTTVMSRVITVDVFIGLTLLGIEKAADVPGGAPLGAGAGIRSKAVAGAKTVRSPAHVRANIAAVCRHAAEHGRQGRRHRDAAAASLTRRGRGLRPRGAPRAGALGGSAARSARRVGSSLSLAWGRFPNKSSRLRAFAPSWLWPRPRLFRPFTIPLHVAGSAGLRVLTLFFGNSPHLAIALKRCHNMWCLQVDKVQPEAHSRSSSREMGESRGSQHPVGSDETVVSPATTA